MSQKTDFLSLASLQKTLVPPKQCCVTLKTLKYQLPSLGLLINASPKKITSAIDL